ncbi:MAG: 2-oxoglutaramate amidase [Verrucomicrobia subdivision 3 bacterium]|nr:2-oxoglutaramate amidase [Limisphaerales bacterium]MCS1416644.1 2-oxoglutaramate amidase [Limisphaerales bacterium]
MKIYGCQFTIQWEAPEANFQTVTDLLKSADVKPDSLIVLPEMFATGFSMNVAKIADNSLTTPFLAETAKRYHSWVIGGHVAKANDGRGLNQAFVLAPSGEQAGVYTKIHPFSFSGENKSYAPGSSIQLFDAGPFRICPLICYDLRFPEIFRTATQDGANVFAVIANWPKPRTAHWLTLLQARAIENQAYVIGINRTGEDPKLHYPGCSIIVSPQGEVMAEGGSVPGLVTADIDLESLTTWRTQFPALQDMRQPFVPHNSTEAESRAIAPQVEPE